MKFTKDSYRRRLMIADHIRELNWMYDQYKAKNLTWDDMRRELADLFILLEAEFLQGGVNPILNERKYRFLEKER